MLTNLHQEKHNPNNSYEIYPVLCMKVPLLNGVPEGGDDKWRKNELWAGYEIEVKSSPFKGGIRHNNMKNL